MFRKDKNAAQLLWGRRRQKSEKINSSETQVCEGVGVGASGAGAEIALQPRTGLWIKSFTCSSWSSMMQQTSPYSPQRTTRLSSWMCHEGRCSPWRGAHTRAGSWQGLLPKGKLTCCSSLSPKNSTPWEEPHARGGEGDAVAECSELTTILIPHSLGTALRVRGRRVRNEGIRTQEAERGLFLFLNSLLYFLLSEK